MERRQLDLPKADILAVDDNPVNLRLLLQILTSKGYKVRPVPNGKLALSAAEAIPPDLILLDINMPEMDGYEVCQKLKENPKTTNIPVIFISAYNNAIDKVKAFGVGGVDYIPKPFQIEEVLVRVHNHLSIRILQKSLQKKNQNLQDTLEELKAAQTQLVQSEKMAALGQLIAGIAHEINTPLGAIRSSIGNIQDFLKQDLYYLSSFFNSLNNLEKEIITKLLKQANNQYNVLSSREKRKIKKKVISQLETQGIDDADSLADTIVDLGLSENLSVIIPLLKAQSGINIFNQIYRFYSLQKSADTIAIATNKAAKIVFALKTHARHDSAETKSSADIIQGIETVLTLYQNQIKQGVEVIKNYQSLPQIYCYPDELNQVWTNLIHNALQAMQYQGKLTIETLSNPQQIIVKITDNGQGISQDILPKIFQPFFTTKPPGEGSGLGLDIVKKIIDKHQATITVSSVPGNTTFKVFLPINNIH
ncbi:Response regulator receiver sensor signal transduction histidine kinase [Hyella patelloides LEGE 07179]|uniref:histidine kinase n=1 Tax=Hyella patelloides LEGE 07179 TaxID=945734 RepID=A0A563VU99_9CYAN|nr:response regulator [Hyella patelloides]VEP15017.1 Response regulator receiver sensor signal transduction histidine kinase [Hyella patelloides LEGE 07179]